MKKYELNLKENEELIVDIDDSMEAELVKFKERIKDLTETEMKIFDNWVKVYKLLNYDIIEGLSVDKVYKFNEFGCVVEITFRGKKEYDFLNLNPETMTVACMNVKDNSVRPYAVRRLLVPDTVEEALTFAKSMIPEKGITSITNLIKDLETKGNDYDVTKLIKVNENIFIRCPEFKEDNTEKREDPRKDFVYSFAMPRAQKTTYSYVNPKVKARQEVKRKQEQKINKPEIKVEKQKYNHTLDVIMDSVKDDGTLDICNLIANAR